MTERNGGNSFLGGLKKDDNSTTSPANSTSTGSSTTASTPTESAPAQTPTSTPASQQNSGSTSVIGHNIQFRGELVGKEDIIIEGRIEGTVLMEGQHLTIGSTGELDANIHAENIVINGKLTGDVLADELIEIKKSAVVKGNLIAPRIQLEDGGKFRGSMDMVDTEEEQKERRESFKDKLVHPDLPARNTNKTTAQPAPSKPAQNNGSTSGSTNKSGDQKGSDKQPGQNK